MDLEFGTWFFFIFIFSLYYTYDHSVCIIWRLFQSIYYANWFIDLCVIWTLWSKCIVPTYICSVNLFIYLFALCYICFCLMMLLILLFAVVDVVAVAYSVFNSFHCSCSGFSMYFTFCRLSVLCCLCCHCVLEPFPFAFVALYLFLFLFNLLNHCVSNSSYCHRYLYDLVLVLLLWSANYISLKFSLWWFHCKLIN